ncbi:MAG: redoxin family protein [Thermomicrobiales bacterium]
MPGWQQFVQRNADKDFRFVSVAVDNQGADAARPWTEKAGATYPTVVDRDNALAAIYDYKLIPNGIFLDEAGIIRYRKFGGFNIENAADVDAIQRLIDGEVAQIELDAKDAPYHLSETERALIDARMRLGAELFARGAQTDAVAEWKQALHLDPENLTIRKQIWMAEYPEKFHPTIDFGWQKGQLARERDEEIAQGICGPDGCPLPQR